MGSCFLAHGVRYKEGCINLSAAKSVASLNLVGSCLLIVPTTLSVTTARYNMKGDAQFLDVSRGIALVLLLLYSIYLFFTLRTHRDLFGVEETETNEGDSEDSAGTVDISLGPKAATAWLVISLAFVSLCTLALVSSIPGSMWTENKVFLGFILFPFLGNITDYLDACTVALNNKMDITIAVTLGSSMQVLLFILPFLVVLGWIINEPMTLQLQLFEAVTVLLGVVIVNGLVSDGKSNYLYGATCIAL